MISNHYTLNGIKSRTVGDGQYGTARFATEKEIRETYAHVPYEPEQWRAGKHLPKEQGLVVGYKKKGNSISALVDSGDIHCLMIGAAGVGKTANFLYPNIEYACASGMSFLTSSRESLHCGHAHTMWRPSGIYLRRLSSNTSKTRKRSRFRENFHPVPERMGFQLTLIVKNDNHIP